MVPLQRLTYEQLVRTVSSRLDPRSGPVAPGRPVSRYRSEPSATPVRIEVYKPTRRAARPVTPQERTPVAVTVTGLEMSYAHFIGTGRAGAHAALAQTA
jgi:hypothetical protein